MTKYALFRRICQVTVTLGFCLLPFAESLGITGILGSLFALELFGIPFADPVACLGVAFSGYMPGSLLLAGAILSLTLAFFLGRVFCSWICPYGLFSEIVHTLAKKRGAEPISQSRAFLMKSVLLLVCLILFAISAYPFLTLISFPGQLSLLPLLIAQKSEAFLILGIALLPSAVLFLEALTGRRLWCRFLCPQSVLLGLSAALLPKKWAGLRIAWDARKCTCKGEAACQAICPMHLVPRHKKGVSRRDCIQCGECIQVCRSHGSALSWNASKMSR